MKFKEKFNNLPKSIKVLAGTVITIGAITIPFTLAMVHDNNIPAEQTNSEQVTTVGELEELTKDIVEKVDIYDTGITFDDIKSNPSEYKHKKATLNGMVLDIEYGKSIHYMLVVVDNDVNKLMSVSFDSDLLPYNLVAGDKITMKAIIGVESTHFFKGNVYPTIGAYARGIEVNYSK